MFSFNNAALRITNGSFDLDEFLWIFLATSSLPEPVGVQPAGDQPRSGGQPNDQLAARAGQLADLQYSLALAPEINWQSDSGDTQVNILAFGRIESADTKRQHLDLREGYIHHEYQKN